MIARSRGTDGANFVRLGASSLITFKRRSRRLSARNGGRPARAANKIAPGLLGERFGGVPFGIAPSVAAGGARPLGGAGDQMPREAVRPIRAKVSRQMGHNRLTTTNAYYGSVTGRPQALGRKVCSLWIGDGLMASLHINPTPLKNDAGEYFKLTEAQLDRAAVHVQIDRDGQSQAVGVWRIKGFSMASLGAVEGIDLVQRQVLSEKLQLVMAPMGWVV